MQINTLKNTTDKLKYNYKNIHITNRKTWKRNLDKKVTCLSSNISIITLNVNISSLNSPIKRQRLPDWIYNLDPIIYKKLASKIVTQVVKSKKMQKINQMNGGVSILISDKVHFRTMTITRVREEHRIMSVGSPKTYRP